MKHIKIIIAFLFWFLLLVEGYSQSWVWAKNVASSWFDYPVITSDQNGNVIQAVNFYGSSCSFSGYFSYPKVGINDMLLIKYNDAGVVQWWKQYGLNNSVDYEWITAMLCDGNGNIYITGTFCTDSLSFGNATLKRQMWYGGYYVPYANFLVKIDASGNTLWAKMIGESGANFYSHSMILDNYGNLYMGGLAANAAVFMNGDTIKHGTFLSKYDSNGNKIWMRQIADYSSPLDYEFGISNINILNDKLYIAGTFRSDTVTIDSLQVFFKPGFIFSAGYCVFDTSGTALQIHTLNDKSDLFGGQLFGRSVSDIHNGYLYLTGRYVDTLYFQTDTLINNSIIAKSFILKLDDNFNDIWVKDFYSNGHGASFIKVNMLNELFVAGNYDDSDINLYNCLSTYVSYPNFGIYVLKLDTNGVCQSVIDTKNGSLWNGIFSGNQLVITGTHTDITFGSTSFTWLNGQDAYIAKIDFTTGVGEQEREGNEALLIYSNPNSGSCTIEIPEALKGNKVLYLQIVNSGGKTVYDKTISNQSKNIQIDLSGNAKGRYVVQLSGKSKKYRGSIVMQ